MRHVCPECDFIYYRNPVPGVGVILEKDGGLVLIKRGQPPDVGEWAFPSGYIEADESIEQAAVRECEEETGLEANLKEMFGVYSFLATGTTQGIVVFYRAEAAGGQMCAGDDAQDVRVFAPDDVPRLCFRTHRLALTRWLRERDAGTHPDRTQGVHVRGVQPEDEDAIITLIRGIPGNRALSEEKMRAAMQRLHESPSLHVFVAESLRSPHEVIGFGALSVIWMLTGRHGWLAEMAVDPLHRRRGVGGALLDAIMRRADRLGLANLYVNFEGVSDVARAFYRAAGFEGSKIGRLRIQ